MKESAAYQYLRRVWRPAHPSALLLRVENAVGPGTPDVYACWRGVSAWFESKVLEETTHPRLGRVLRPREVQRAQPPWALDARRAGVPLFGALVHAKWPRGAVRFISLDGLLTLYEQHGLAERDLKRHEVALSCVFAAAEEEDRA